MALAAKKIEINHVDRLGYLLTKQKRIKLIVGGRASTKSTFVADHCLERMGNGASVCCAREYQNTIEDSVHALLEEEIERLEFPGFTINKTNIEHYSGGRNFYKGLARNIKSLKGIMADILWIEEGETLSDDTMKILTASIRVSALEQTKAEREGREIKLPEIWITMNRGSSKDAISKHLLSRAEKELERCGFYEDDLCMVLEINYDENPWFEGSGLEVERADDEKHLSQAAYDHKWHGAYSDTIEGAIIQPEWFDACIDAHLLLGFAPEGREVVTYDPFDDGDDAAAYLHLHGSVFVYGEEKTEGEIDICTDWALDYVQQVKPDAFGWDAGGMGTGLKRQINDALKGKNIDIFMFEGQREVEDPKKIYEPAPGTMMKEKTHKEAFFNLRSQKIWELRDRIYWTYLAVRDKTFTDPGKLISFSSEIPCLSTLRAEACRIPKIPNGQGKIKIMSKEQMKKEGIDSPNLFDCGMMALYSHSVQVKIPEIECTGWG